MREILLAFQKACQVHTLVRTFNYGAIADLNDDYTEYPALFVEVDETFSASGTGQVDYEKQDVNLDFYVLTKSKRYGVDEAHNKINVDINEEVSGVSLCERITLQVMNWMNEAFEDRLIDVEPLQWGITPQLRVFNDDLNGVRCTVALKAYPQVCDFETFYGEEMNTQEEYKDVNNQ